MIIQQGQEARRVFIIASGECRVLLRLQQEDGSTQLLQAAALGPRDFFGEIGVMTESQHTASVVASSDVSYLAIHKADLLSIADGGVAQRLAEAARSYPTEAELLQQLQLGQHWRAYKEVRVCVGNRALMARRLAQQPAGHSHWLAAAALPPTCPPPRTATYLPFTRHPRLLSSACWITNIAASLPEGRIPRCPTETLSSPGRRTYTAQGHLETTRVRTHANPSVIQP